MDTKTCSQCGETKPLDAFNAKRVICKACQCAYRKAYREANKEKAKAYKKAYREANKEKAKAYKKAYHEANKEKAKARDKAYREANKEKIKARDKAYYEANREANREARKEKDKAYYKTNPLSACRSTAKKTYKRAGVDAPGSIIETRAALIQLKREIRKQTNEKLH